MSRALDPGVITSLKNSQKDAQKGGAAWAQITGALTNLPPEGLLDIEVLGSGHPFEPGTFVLQDGPALGVSKAGLVQAFVGSRKFLNQYFRGSKLRDEQLLRMTALMLLLDPEHLTAANIRKKVLKTHLSEPAKIHSSLDREKRFIDSLLTSRLHRHTKSPTLWSHRRWLVELSAAYSVPTDIEADMTRVIMISAERHPRNYYAWSHARWLLEFTASKHGISNKTEEGLLAGVQEWCLKHHTDISGWSFLHHLLETRRTAQPETWSAVFTRVLSLASSFRWANESVWVFLRTTAASGSVSDRDVEEFEKVRAGLKTTLTPESLEWKTVEAAGTWVRENQHEAWEVIDATSAAA